MSKKTKVNATEKTEHSVFKNVVYIMRLFFSISPKLVITDIAVHLVSHLPQQIFAVSGLKFVIDSVANSANISHIFIVAAAFVVILVIGEAANGLYFELFAHRERENLYLGLHSRLYEKAASLDLESYDNPSFYNDFILAVETSSENIRTILNNVRELVTAVVSLITVSSILLTIDPLCTVIIVVFSLAFIPLGKKIAVLQMEYREDLIKKRRKSDYFARLFYLPEYAGEIRSNGIYPLLMGRFHESVHGQLICSKRHLPKIYRLMFLQVSGSEIIGLMLILTAYIGYCVIVKHSMTPGDFVATFNGAGVVGSSLIYISVYCVRRFSECSKTIEKYRVFLNTQPNIKDGPHTALCNEPETICIEDVSFTYPGSNSDALNGVNLEIKPYEKVALVGYNGAGKTTLTNLLLRLYDVQHGTIKIGGRDIREETVKSHRDRFSAVFQDFQIYGASVGENVAMSPNFDENRVLEALKMASFDKELPQGVNTILLREFSEEGVVLSGGEGQKIAIARAFYKQCPYIILDEPSANLDTYSEYELNHAIMTKSENKTVIVISHRLSTAKSADRIIMMDGGKIVETGSHEQLMAQGGKYAEMFIMQAEKYASKMS